MAISMGWKNELFSHKARYIHLNRYVSNANYISCCELPGYLRKFQPLSVQWAITECCIPRWYLCCKGHTY